ncbi:MAG: FG-GAP repeat domain-containing protein [Chlorobiales bacterium]
MFHTCNDAQMYTPSMLLVLLMMLLFTIEASSNPLPTYFRYELLKSGALTNLVVADFDGDGHKDIAGLTPSQLKLAVVPAKGKLAFFPHQSFNLSSRVKSLFAVDIVGEKRASLALLASTPSRAQLWRLGGRVGKFSPAKRAELSLPDDAERLYLSRQHLSNNLRFFARTETGTLTAFSFQPKEGFSKGVPLSLSHRVSEVVLSARPSSDFFTQVVGENTLWLHRPPPTSPLMIRCKESVSLAATGDFNKNDLLDLVLIYAVANGKTAVEVMFDIGVETGVAPIRFATPLNPTHAFIEDFDADGLLDIGLCDGFSFAIHFAQSPTTFLEGMIIAFSDVASGVTVADLNQDSKVELIVSEQKTGKLVVYSSSHYERLGVERLATSGKPTHISVHASRKQMLVSCNRHHQIEQVQVDRQFRRIGSFSVEGEVVSHWQDKDEMSWLTTSPVTLVRKPYKSRTVVSHRLFSLGVSQSVFWSESEGRPAILAILEERTEGALPQLLFYALDSDSVLSISEILLETPMSAEGITSIGGATLKNRHYLAVLKSEKNVFAVTVYELKSEKSRMRLVEVGRYALPNFLATQAVKFFLVKVNKNETMDFFVASSKSGVLLLSERLYQPKQISNFPKLSETDVVLWDDGDGDGLADLFISRHQRAEVLFLRGRTNGVFDTPRIILGDVIATDMTSVVVRQQATLFVANAKLHTVDILRLKK